MENICYLNGQFVPMKDATVSVRDLGFLRGFGVFDVMPVVNGKPFCFEDHWDRLERSAAELGLTLPLGAKEAMLVMKDLIGRHEYQHMIVRTVLSGGPSEGGFLPEGKETFAIMIEATKPLAEELYEKGGTLLLLEHERTLPLSKTTNYIFPIAHRKRKAEADAIEILYAKDGSVLEASTSNFFLVKDGTIVTAKAGVLGGITRKLALRLASELGIPSEERVIRLAELDTCDEAFLTASNKQVLPIVRVGEKTIGDGTVGQISKRLLSTYRKLLAEY